MLNISPGMCSVNIP